MMLKTIQQSVTLPAPADRLFDMYLDPKAHAAFTGHPVIIGHEAGYPFEAFERMLTGIILRVVPKRLIVQSWRSVKFKPDDLDSTLILSFWPEGDAGRIELVHANVPDHDAEQVNRGWEEHYWGPWKRYLESLKK